MGCPSITDIQCRVLCQFYFEAGERVCFKRFECLTSCPLTGAGPFLNQNWGLGGDYCDTSVDAWTGLSNAWAGIVCDQGIITEM